MLEDGDEVIEPLKEGGGVHVGRAGVVREDGEVEGVERLVRDDVVAQARVDDLLGWQGRLGGRDVEAEVDDSLDRVEPGIE